MQENRGHIEAVNIARGIAIMLAVLGHAFLSNETGIQKYLFDFIYGFHMPLFFFISGYCNIGILKKRTWKSIGQAIGTRFGRLMIPYLSFGILYVFLDVIGGKYSFADFRVGGYALELLKGDNANWQLWTLYALFTCYTLTALLHRVLLLKGMLGVSAVLFVVMSVLCTIPGLPSWLFYTIITKTAQQWFFFVSGLCVRTYWDVFQKPAWTAGRMSLGLLILACISIWGTVRNVPLLILVTAPLGTLCVVELTKYLTNTKGKSLLALFGANSMDIYIFANIFQVLVREILLKRVGLPETICVLLSFGAGLFIPLAVGKLVRKIYPLQVLLLGDLSRDRRSNGVGKICN